MSLISGSSAQLTEFALSTIMDGIKQNTNIFKIKTILRLEEEDIYPISIKAFRVNQDYINNYFDDIQLVVELHPLDAIKLIDNKNNVKCIMTYTSFHPQYLIEKFDIPPDIREYQAVVHDSEDLRKRISLAVYTPNDTENTGVPTDENQLGARINIQLSLFSEYVYTKRLLRVNTILGPKVTMDNVINYLMNSFRIERCSIVPSDNPYVFTNVQIPPSHGLNSIFYYLQDQYGIYSKGIAGYFCDDIYYLFRPFDTDVSTPTTLHVVSLPNARLKQAESFTCITPEEDVKMVSTLPVDITNFTEKGSENIGTVQMQLNTDTLIDHFHKVHKDGKIELNQSKNLNIINNASGSLAKTDAINLVYRGSSTNPYISSSLMSSHHGAVANISIVKMGFLPLYPGMSVQFHYDDDKGQYSLAKGILLGVNYQLKDIPGIHGNEYMYTMVGTITIMFVPDIPN